MCIAKNGTAIILDEVVPPMEVQVLRILGRAEGKDGLIVRQLCDQCLLALIHVDESTVSTYLNRLLRKYLVTREVRYLDFQGKKYRRVLWKVVAGVPEFFREHDETQE